MGRARSAYGMARKMHMKVWTENLKRNPTLQDQNVCVCVSIYKGVLQLLKEHRALTTHFHLTVLPTV
jgi:hypothetical protein